LKKIFNEFPDPNYEHHSNLDVTIMSVRDYQYPLGKEWDYLMPYIKKELPPPIEEMASVA